MEGNPMSASNDLIHPTAIISPEAKLAEGVKVGPYVVIEGDVQIGRDSVIHPYVQLVGQLEIGERTEIGTGSVIGTPAQHMGYKGEPTGTKIGNDTVIREHVTVHRAFVTGASTQIGDNCYLMANSHVGHDVVLENKSMLVNGAIVGGHAVIGASAIVSGNAGVHQFNKIGRFAIVTGCIACTRDVIPFTIVGARDRVVGVNIIGLKRGGFSSKEISRIRQAFKLIYRSGMILSVATEELERTMGDDPLAMEIVAFIRSSKRGILRAQNDRQDDD
jgi:UDP-N-acetylglucosamine acyltransferase